MWVQVGQDMTFDDAIVADAEGMCRLNVVELADFQGFCAD